MGFLAKVSICLFLSLQFFFIQNAFSKENEDFINICDRGDVVWYLLNAIKEYNGDCSKVSRFKLESIRELRLHSGLWEEHLIYELTENAFKDLIKLEKLEILQQPLSHFPENIFIDNERLEYVYLSNLPNFNEIPRELFSKNKNFEQLYLADVPSIKTLPAGLFRNLTRFRLFIFLNTGLETLPGKLFQDTHLEKFIIGGNFQEACFSSLPGNLFYGAEHLQSAVFCLKSNDESQKLPENLFQNLPSLKSVRFKLGNRLEIPPRFFANLPELKKLYFEFPVDENEVLPSNLFENTTNLQTLDLLPLQNFIKLPNKLFLNLPNLETLKLINVNFRESEKVYSYTKTEGAECCETISDGAFAGLNNIKKIYLKSILLDDIPSHAFRTMGNTLEWLIIENAGKQKMSIHENAFSDLVKVENLGIYSKHIVISDIDPNAFVGAENLIDLRFKRIDKELYKDIKFNRKKYKIREDAYISEFPFRGD